MAEVKTQCARCHKKIRAPRKFAGRSASCPKCKGPVQFPELARREEPSAPSSEPSTSSDIPGIDFPLPVAPTPLGASPPLPPPPPPPPAPPGAGVEVVDHAGSAPLGNVEPASVDMPPLDFNGSGRRAGGPLDQFQIDTTGGQRSTAPTPAADDEPFHIDTDRGAASASQTRQDDGAGDNSYTPILRPAGSKKTMAAKSVEKTLGKLQRGRVTSCRQFKLGPDQSFWERVHTLGVFPQELEIEADEVHVIAATDRAGEFRLVMPFDKGIFCPVEYVSLMPGSLPTSLGLLRGKGGNWGLRLTNTAAGSLLHPTMQSALSAAGGQAEAVWTVLDANDPSAASDVLNEQKSLNAQLRFDSRVKLGMVEVTHQLDWIAQALPLGPEHYLLIARYIPRNKTMSIEFGVDWYLKWRDAFHKLVPALPAGAGHFCPFEHGLWSAVTRELMGIQVL